MSPKIELREKRIVMFLIGLSVGFAIWFGGTGTVKAATTSGWKTEKALTSGLEVVRGYLYPYLGFNLT